MIKINTVVVKDIYELADMVNSMYHNVTSYDGLNNVVVVAKYYEAKTLIENLISERGYEIGNITDLSDVVANGYSDEYIVTLFVNEINCEPAKVNNRYKDIYADAIYILENCNSKVMSNIHGEENVFEVYIDENDCEDDYDYDEDCENCCCFEDNCTCGYMIILRRLNKNANDVVNIDGTNYRAVWTRRTASGGTQDSGYNVISTSVSVAYTDISTDYIYTCTVQKIENNQWHDVISAEITIIKNIYEVLKTEYYNKEESPKAILTILGETEISTVNGKENSIISTIQTTHETVDTFEKVIEKNNTTINDFVNKSASVYQDYDEFKTTVKKTYATNTKVDELANGNNLLRNSDTLIYDEYSIGSKLIDASGNMLIDASGYILIA